MPFPAAVRNGRNSTLRETHRDREFIPWPSVTYCCMAHDAAHQVTHINSVPGFSARKGISLTVTVHVSASDCGSGQGAAGNSIISPQYQISTPGPSSTLLPQSQAGFLGCSCHTRRSFSVATDKITEKDACVEDSTLHLSPACYRKTD